MKAEHKAITGVLLLLLALALITAGFGSVWGTAGACVGAGIMSAIYGYVLLTNASK